MSTQLLQLLERARLPEIGTRLMLREKPMLAVEATAEEYKEIPQCIKYKFIAEFGAHILVDAREGFGAADYHLKHVRHVIAQAVYAEVKQGLIDMFDALYRLRQESREQAVFAISAELLERVNALLEEITP